MDGVNNTPISQSIPQKDNVSELNKPKRVVFVLSTVFILLIIVGVILLLFLFRNLKEGVVMNNPAKPVEIRGELEVDDKGNPLPEVADIPTPESIEKCNTGPFPEGPGIPLESHRKGWIFGVITEKLDDEKMTIKVEQIYDGTIKETQLYDIDIFEYREILDRKSYEQGKVTSFKHVQFKSGEPYVIGEIYPHLSIGTHVWVFEVENYGKYMQIYCDSE